MPLHDRATEVHVPHGGADEGEPAEAEARGRLVQPETEHGREESDDRREERVQHGRHGGASLGHYEWPETYV